MSLERIFGALDAPSVASLVAGSSEIALLLDSDGIVRDVSVSNEELAKELDGVAAWRGQHVSNCVTIDSKSRIETLFKQASVAGLSRRVHLNHVGRSGASVPVAYTIVRVDPAGTSVALGRDLRIVSTLQQRLVDAQQSLDRDYIRLRHIETRYRLLFEMTSEAVVILDARSFRVTEANGPARALLGSVAEQSHGIAFHELFDSASMESVQAHLVLIRMAGRGEQITARLAAHGLEISFSAWLIREEDSNLLLVRMHESQAASPREALSQNQAARLAALERAPDGFVLIAESGRILGINPAFLDLVQLLSEEQAIGASLDQWLGRPGVDLNVLIANLRQRGSVRLFQTTLRSQFGALSDVEISAVGITVQADTQFALTIRDVGRRLQGQHTSGPEQPRSVEQLTELIGRVPLKDLVRESTDMIERLSIEAALTLTKDNRASAAELLGLSRQSLYVKLRRYGLGELDESD